MQTYVLRVGSVQAPWFAPNTEISGLEAALGAGSLSVVPVSISASVFHFNTFHFVIISDWKEFVNIVQRGPTHPPPQLSSMITSSITIEPYQNRGSDPVKYHKAHYKPWSGLPRVYTPCMCVSACLCVGSEVLLPGQVPVTTIVLRIETVPSRSGPPVPLLCSPHHSPWQPLIFLHHYNFIVSRV